MFVFRVRFTMVKMKIYYQYHFKICDPGIIKIKSRSGR